jgi:hypothetical protein
MSQEPTDMAEIMEAITILHSGDRATARTALLRLWEELGERGTPTQRCTIAHFLADTEDKVEAELAWDLLALRAATGKEQDADHDALEPDLASFLPSLHLNVGDAYRRLGDLDRARAHARFGLGQSEAMPAGGYGDMVRTGLERLQTRLASADSA